MTRVINLLAWGMVAVVAALAALNWPTLMTPAPLNLVVATVSVPLGAVMLGLSAVLVALFFVAYLRNQIGSLLETRKLLQEIQRVQNLADKAEASRVENLHQLISSEFRRVHERLNTVPQAASPAAGAEPAQAGDDFKPLSLSDIVTGREAR
jgi:ABC-type multidrug transport system fused ATPase/permease subunit